ncbi:glycosyltransferase [Streptomyces tsukubensis]|uniref:4,4'-diaponeurosporenoate glycosyltransferase n=1 Tax=Streptomyces tsukubensis TaxID=83656 RepID=A0A1V4AG22_9ACTN|nr:glycosyltransferase family 2 protein [Streptomyces tsukubensis]OON82628.1 hypothetical protein B1H18_00740 [Streptomyces tsukubensis]QFR92200.1 glycosyltransferase [Streptomyces tsukubensis]
MREARSASDERAERRPPPAIAVVVPAHNESALLGATLRSTRAAARRLGPDGPRVVTVVAADACTDGTAAVARRHGAHVVEVSRRNVGAARAAAVTAALGLLGEDAWRTWIAVTDADTVVPARWLSHQLFHAGRGWECVVGTVRVASHPPVDKAVLHRHDALYFAGRPPVRRLPWDHPHVHGANLGVTAEAYRSAGGFPPLTHGEDRALVAALEREGRRILRTDRCPVRTAGRSTPRAPHGFGAFLRALDHPAETGAEPPELPR